MRVLFVLEQPEILQALQQPEGVNPGFGGTSFTTVRLVPGTPPKVTKVAPVKPDPFRVTVVLPVVGPMLGLNDVSAGGDRYSYAEELELTVPPMAVTITVA